MRCVNPAETLELFGDDFPFTFTAVDVFQRHNLRPKGDIAARQRRIDGRPPQRPPDLPHFADGLNRWHPPNVRRLLWVDSAEVTVPSCHPLFMAARAGMGDGRSLFEAPGQCFEAFPYDEWDQMAVSPEQVHETGLLVGLVMLMMIGTWDGWLVAAGSADAVEFWEGNLFFYSDSKSRLAEAEAVLSKFDCPRELT
jgi:hypothetical protein